MEDREKKVEGIGEKVEDNQSFGFSSKIKNKLFSILTTKIKNSMIRYRNPREYFSNVLELSEFEWLEKMVKDTDGKISWEKLAIRGVVKIKNKKIEWIYWKEYLDLRWTRIKSLGNLKKIRWGLCCENVESLEDIWKLEEIWGYVNINWTKIKSLGNLKKVGRGLYCRKLDTLVDLWKLEEVGDNLTVRWTKIKTLWKLKKVGGILYVKETDIRIQLEIIKKLKEKKLKVWELEYNESIDRIYEDEKINYDKYRKMFGEDINKIEDEEMKTIWEGILRWEYKKIKKEIEEKVKNIIEENKWKKYTEKKKKEIRKQILELDKELERQKEKIESFGISL